MSKMPAMRFLILFDIDYVKAHGTGTAAGDPIEPEAILSIFNINRIIDNPILIDLIKINIEYFKTCYTRIRIALN